MNNNLNEKESLSQCDLILNYLQEGNRITALKALRLFGCFRLSSRIWDLKQRGVEIKKEWVKTKNNKKIMSFFL